MLAGSFLAEASTGQPTRAYECPARLAFRSWRARIVRRGSLNGAWPVAPFRLLDAFTRHAGKSKTSGARWPGAWWQSARTSPFASPEKKREGGQSGNGPEPTDLCAQGVGPVLAPSLQKCRHGSEVRGG